MRERWWVGAMVLAAATMSGSCGATAPHPVASPELPPADRGAPPITRTHENLNATVWMQTSVEYRASALQAYHAARVALDAALADRHETAALEQTADPSQLPPAVVLDLDETVLDNSPFEARLIAQSTFAHPVGYTEQAWSEWTRERRATAIAGAVEFLKYAAGRGVTPIYISNRDAGKGGEADARAVLTRLGMPVANGDDTVLLRGENGWDSSDKGPRRAWVAARHRILLLVGDNVEDFITVPPRDQTLAGRDAMADRYGDWWGTKWIVVPNPTYGSWESAITVGAPRGQPQAALNRKYAALRTR
jgi:acid phosphatase